MRKYCTTIKNKAYIFLEVIIISFLFISLTLFVQILLNNSFKLYKVDYETQENFQNLDFLKWNNESRAKIYRKNIMMATLKCSWLYSFNEAGEKIFLIADPSKRISLGGYTLLNDEIKINAFNFVNIHFKKKITIKDKTYLILATVKYEVGSSRDLGSLYNGVLTRMWIKEDV